MPSKDPTTYSVLTYLWVFILAMAGGLVAFIRRLNKSRKPQPLLHIFLKLFGELVISAFAGIITFYLCEYWSFNQLFTAVLVGVAGHLGGGAIDKFEKIWQLATDKNL